MIGSILGHPVRRVEDPRFLTGAARYVEDIPAEGALWAAFVRSPFAHARITGLDLGAARAAPGVAGLYAAYDLGLPSPSDEDATAARQLLASEVVRYVGEPIAVVLAETRAQALDAAEAVVVEFDPLPAVADPVRAMEPDAPLLFPEHGSNVVLHKFFGPKDALSTADVVVRGRFVNQRLAPSPLEPNALLAIPGADGRSLTVYIPSQAPFWAREELAEALGLAEEDIRVIAPDVGGGFGAKAETNPEQRVVAALALRVGRPVRYAETRSENLVAMTHGRAQVQDVEVGATREGLIVGMRVHLVADLGAYALSTFLSRLTRQMAVGVYRIPKVRFETSCVVTNTTPVGAYRGAGRPEAAALIERTVDLVAVELGLDPVEVRKRNLIPADAFPYRTPTGSTYDVGDYGRALDEAIRLAGYDALRSEQAERRTRGDRLQMGIGVSCYVEVTGWRPEYGSVEVGPDGSVTVLTGTSPHGQGHETAWAQIVAGTLGVALDEVRVVHSDTGVVPRGDGTMGSRSLQIGGSAVKRAGEAVVEKARRLAGHLLEASVDDVVQFEDGRIGIAGAPGTALGWADLAIAANDGDRMPPGMEPGLAADTDFKQQGNTFPFGAHVAMVEVDTDTGLVRLIRHVAVDDCGRILNPLLVQGQVHGGLAQGIAQAMFEEVLYDDDGNPLTASLMTYEMPSPADLPSFETAHTETPTPLNPLGAKGIGESATIGSTPAVQNAVVDALSHLGVRHIDLPLTPERVWRAIQEAIGRG